MARRRFFVDEIRGGRAEISGDEAHHLTRVLRVERGQLYEISDNRNSYLAEVAEAHKSRVLFAVREPVPPRPMPVRVSLYLALVKFDRLEWIFEKGAELGVARFQPVVAARSEKGLDKAVPARAARWRRILLESSQQCRRDRLPELSEPLAFARALSSGESTASHRFLLDEDPSAEPILAALPAAPSPGAEVSLLVGPEGGWTDAERLAARDAGWRPASVSSQILRAETAALAGVAVIAAHWASHAGTQR